jgi:DNA-binding transcriptional regulator GbsR (MarR family)
LKIRNREYIIKRLEERIEEDEAAKIKLQKELEQAYEQKNTSRGKQIANKLKKIITRLDHLYKQWEELM